MAGKRRTKGDGGLRQRHDHPTCPPIGLDGERPDHRCRGRWVATLDVWQGGVKRRKYLYARTQVEARRKLTQALRERSDGTLVVATTTVEKWMEHWLDTIASRALRPQTLSGYRSKVDQYIKPTIGKIRLPALRPDHIRGMHDWMRAKGLAEASVRQTHAILKRALKIAVHEGRLGTSPAERMESPGSGTAKRTQLTLQQARAVLKQAGDDPRWWLALFYGMRQGEALGLRWCDIDTDAGLIRIEQSLQRGEDGQMIFGPPKSAKSVRVIPLLPQIDVRLRLLRAQGESESGLVFHSDGAPVRPRADWQSWRDLLEAASAPPVALHAARNSAASLMEAAGVPDRVVAQILGHSQVQITHGYQTAELSVMRAGLDRVGELLKLE